MVPVMILSLFFIRKSGQFPILFSHKKGFLPSPKTDIFSALSARLNTILHSSLELFERDGFTIINFEL